MPPPPRAVRWASRWSTRCAAPRSEARPQSAHATGLRHLARRPHSRAELDLKLTRAGYPAAEVEAALDRLAQAGWLDDGAFAEALVRRRLVNRGRLAVAAELRQRGVSRGTVQAVLADSEPEEVAAARRLAAKWLPGSTRRQVAARLLRRGFSDRVVRQALAEAPD